MNSSFAVQGRDPILDARNIAVIGFGKTGRALLDFLIPRTEGGRIFLYNDTPVNDQKLKEFYQKQNIEFLEGEKDFSRLEEMEILAVSPGIDARASRFDRIRQAGGTIVSEIELASRFIPSSLVAVTGTNGKSTTVSLIHHLLKSSGRSSLLAGNIGNPLIAEVDGLDPETVVVLELSSFQLEEIIGFRPHIAVLLNVTPDHLDRYPDLDSYLAAKIRITENQESEDFLVVNREDPRLGEGIQTRARVIGFSLSRVIERGYYLEKDRIIENMDTGKEEISLSANPLVGIHNLENILASVAVCRILGVSARQIEAGLGDFRGLSHRSEVLGRIGRVEFINDSKATNVDAVLKSISGFNSDVVLILGGKDKGGDFRVLEGPLEKRTAKVLLMGHAAGSIAAQLDSIKSKMEGVRDLREAVRRGYETLKKRGGTVLLAPGCASFDMFDNFEHRGECFREEFLKLKREENNG